MSDFLGRCGVATNAVVLIFLVVQVRLLREQVHQAKDAFVAEQVRSRKQSTLEFMAALIDRLRVQSRRPTMYEELQLLAARLRHMRGMPDPGTSAERPQP